MNDQQLLRYSRHIMLDEIGIEGQEKLLAAHALVIGAGGLGSPVALYLASAGIGRITLVDHDTVDLTNLQRQILHTTERVGQPKAESGRRSLAAIWLSWRAIMRELPTVRRVSIAVRTWRTFRSWLWRRLVRRRSMVARLSARRRASSTSRRRVMSRSAIVSAASTPVARSSVHGSKRPAASAPRRASDT